MPSELLFKLTGVFLILYISVTSATPAAQPVEARKINDDIPARDAILARDLTCPGSYIWKRREALSASNTRAWQDVCAYSPSQKGFQSVIFYNNQLGLCPDNTICLDAIFRNNDRSVQCVHIDNQSPVSTGDSQVGTSDTKSAAATLANTQLKHPVTIENDMMEASVAAVLTSNDGKFIIAPNNIIVGKVHGKNIEVCTGDKTDISKLRKCYPNARFNLKKGDIIDFTWGMINNQEGKLVFGIFPH